MCLCVCEIFLSEIYNDMSQFDYAIRMAMGCESGCYSAFVYGDRRKTGSLGRSSLLLLGSLSHKLHKKYYRFGYEITKASFRSLAE